MTDQARKLGVESDRDHIAAESSHVRAVQLQEQVQLQEHVQLNKDPRLHDEWSITPSEELAPPVRTSTISEIVLNHESLRPTSAHGYGTTWLVATGILLGLVLPAAWFVSTPPVAISHDITLEPPGPLGQELAEEYRLMRQAQLAVRNHDFRRALHLCEEHRASFPDGYLAQERELFAIDALAGLGHGGKARIRAYRFARAYAGSEHANKVLARSYFSW